MKSQSLNLMFPTRCVILPLADLVNLPWYMVKKSTTPCWKDWSSFVLHVLNKNKRHLSALKLLTALWHADDGLADVTWWMEAYEKSSRGWSLGSMKKAIWKKTTYLGDLLTMVINHILTGVDI